MQKVCFLTHDCISSCFMVTSAEMVSASGTYEKAFRGTCVFHLQSIRHSDSVYNNRNCVNERTAHKGVNNYGLNRASLDSYHKPTDSYQLLYINSYLQIE